jgi:hypothetical protein
MHLVKAAHTRVFAQRLEPRFPFFAETIWQRQLTLLTFLGSLSARIEQR